MRVGPLSQQIDKSRRHMRALAVTTDYADDVPLSVISERYDLAPATISKYARAAGLPKRRGPLTEKKVELVLKLYRGNVKIKDIVEQAKVDRKTIWVITKKAGLPLRNPHNNKNKK